MPMITVRYVTHAAKPDIHADVAALASRLAAEHLRKDPAVTAVLAEPADPYSWFVARKHPTDEGLSAFWLDIKITAGPRTRVGQKPIPVERNLRRAPLLVSRRTTPDVGTKR